MTSPFTWARVAASSAARLSGKSKCGPALAAGVGLRFFGADLAAGIAGILAGAAGLFAGAGFVAALGFDFGLDAGVDLTGRAAVAFDAATDALDRAFKNGWAAYG